MTNNSDVWITGIGAVTSLGTDFATISANLLAGKTGIRTVTDFSVDDHACQIAGQVSLPACPPELDPAAYDPLFPFEQCTLWCCVQALQDAGLWTTRSNLRVGIILGLGAEWMLHWDSDARRGGTMIYDNTTAHPALVDSLRQALGVRGPAVSVAAACASGNHALAQANAWLEMGWVDICLAGATDIGVTPLSLASFGNLRVLSRRNDAPEAALRPFDRDRDGMVLGEGGAIFVLERADHARARQREAYAQVAGVGMTSDAHHLVIPDSDPTQAVAAMRQALASARVNPDDVDYVNAHATGTTVGDVCEARALNIVLGPHCRDVPVSSTKSMTGHLLSAAAAVEALACLTAMVHGAIPPTLNLENPDLQCDLCHVANQTREHRIRVAVSNSFGFGGHNTSLILKAIEP